MKTQLLNLAPQTLRKIAADFSITEGTPAEIAGKLAEYLKSYNLTYADLVSRYQLPPPDEAKGSAEAEKLLEKILTIDGQGRPRKAAQLLTILETLPENSIRTALASIAQRKFF